MTLENGNSNDDDTHSNGKFKTPIEYKEDGDILFRKGNFEDAIRFYEKAIELEPNYIRAWNNKGIALLKLNRVDDAKICQDKIFELRKLSSQKSLIKPQSFPKKQEQEIQKRNICSFCENDCLLPFKCQYCGNEFCDSHRLPPNHNCVHLEGWKNQPISTVGMSHSADGKIHATGGSTPTRKEVIQNKKELSKYYDNQFCENCGISLPYNIEDWPPNTPKICPKCGINIKGQTRWGSNKGILHSDETKLPFLSSILSLVWPGLGQAYNGQYLKALIISIVEIVGAVYFSLIFFAGIIYGIIDAYYTSKKMNYGDIPFVRSSAKYMMLYFFLPLMFLGVIYSFGGLGSNFSGSLPGQSGNLEVSNSMGSNSIAPTYYSSVNNVNDKIRTVNAIAADYHKTHTYIGKDVFVCGDMASDVWNMLETKGINAEIQIGNVEKDISSLEEVNHAWVMAEIEPGSWLAVETTAGYTVSSNDNPKYYRGWSFESPKELKEYLQLVSQYQLQFQDYNRAISGYNSAIEAYNQEFDTNEKIQLLFDVNAKSALVSERANDLINTREKINSLLGMKSSSAAITAKQTQIPAMSPQITRYQSDDEQFVATINEYNEKITHNYNWAMKTYRDKDFDQCMSFSEKLQAECGKCKSIISAMKISSSNQIARDRYIQGLNSIILGGSKLYQAANANNFGSTQGANDLLVSASNEFMKGFSLLQDANYNIN